MITLEQLKMSLKSILSIVISKNNELKEKIDEVNEKVSLPTSWNDLKDKPFCEYLTTMESVTFYNNGGYNVGTDRDILNRLKAICLENEFITVQVNGLTFDLYRGTYSTDMYFYNDVAVLNCNRYGGIFYPNALGLDTTPESYTVDFLKKDIKQLDDKFLPTHSHSWNNLKDRPFGEDENIIFEETVDFSEDQIQENILQTMLVEGKYYKVIWDNVEYECIARKNNHGEIYIGNQLVSYEQPLEEIFPEIIESNEPFYISTSKIYNWSGITSADTYSHTVKIVELTISKLNPKYLPGWDAIEGKPFYEEVINTVIFEEQTFEGFEIMDGSIHALLLPLVTNFTKGDTYKIIWDGTEYECSCELFDLEGYLYIGNANYVAMLPGGDIPFCIIIIPDEVMFFLTESTEESHTVSITHVKRVDKLNPESLPEHLQFGETLGDKLITITVENWGNGEYYCGDSEIMQQAYNIRCDNPQVVLSINDKKYNLEPGEYNENYNYNGVYVLQCHDEYGVRLQAKALGLDDTVASYEITLYKPNVIKTLDTKYLPDHLQFGEILGDELITVKYGIHDYEYGDYAAIVDNPNELLNKLWNISLENEQIVAIINGNTYTLINKDKDMGSYYYEDNYVASFDIEYGGIFKPGVLGLDSSVELYEVTYYKYSGIKKIDEKYLPDNISNIDDIQNDINNTIENLTLKMDIENPTGTGSFSLNRKADTVIGDWSFAEGIDTTASGYASHAEGQNTIADAEYQHVQGRYNSPTKWIKVSEDKNGRVHFGNYNDIYVSPSYTFNEETGKFIFPDDEVKSSVEYRNLTGTGFYFCLKNSYVKQDDSTKGIKTIFYRGNTTDIMHTSERDIKAFVVGNGTADDARSNAHTLDWDGNAEFAGDVKANACGGTTPISLVETYNLVNGAKNLFITTVTKNDDGTYSADRTFNEITTAYNEEKLLIAHVESAFYQFYAKTSDMFAFTLSVSSGNSVFNRLCKINSDNTVKLEEIIIYHYQSKTDEDLTTTDKTIVGAINEINTNSATKEYVDTVLGDIESLLAAI